MPYQSWQNPYPAHHLVEKLACEVNDELADAERMRTELVATQWDMSYAMEQQSRLESKYRKKK